MVIRTRRRAINAAKALRDRDDVPPGVDDPKPSTCYRSGGVILPRDTNWLEATRRACGARPRRRSAGGRAARDDHGHGHRTER